MTQFLPLAWHGQTHLGLAQSPSLGQPAQIGHGPSLGRSPDNRYGPFYTSIPKLTDQVSGMDLTWVNLLSLLSGGVAAGLVSADRVRKWYSSRNTIDEPDTHELDFDFDFELRMHIHVFYSFWPLCKLACWLSRRTKFINTCWRQKASNRQILSLYWPSQDSYHPWKREGKIV